MKLTETFSLNLTETKITKLENNRRRVERAKAQHCNVVNKNKRRYPFEKTWGRHIKEGTAFMSKVLNREVFGHIEHPQDGRADLNKAAILVEKVWMEGDEVFINFATLSTTPGKTIASLIDDKLNFGLSSRATGSIKTCEDGVDEVQEDFEPETWDAVADPSVGDARVTEEVNKRLTESCAQTEKEKALKEGSDEPGKQDGTGPFAGSAQAAVSDIGKRKAAGEPCPVEQDGEEEPEPETDKEKEPEEEEEEPEKNPDEEPAEPTVAKPEEEEDMPLPDPQSVPAEATKTSKKSKKAEGAAGSMLSNIQKKADIYLSQGKPFWRVQALLEKEFGLRTVIVNPDTKAVVFYEMAKKTSAGTSRSRKDEAFRIGTRHIVPTLPDNLSHLEDQYPEDLFTNVSWDKHAGMVSLLVHDEPAAKALSHAISQADSNVRIKVRSRGKDWQIKAVGGKGWVESTRKPAMKKQLKEFMSIGNSVVLDDSDFSDIYRLMPSISGPVSLERHLKRLDFDFKSRRSSGKYILAFSDSENKYNFMDLLDAWGFNESAGKPSKLKEAEQKDLQYIFIAKTDERRASHLFKGVMTIWDVLNSSFGKQKYLGYGFSLEDVDDAKQMLDGHGITYITLESLKDNKVQGALHEAAKKLISRLLERNKELSKALTEAQKRISLLEEINETMDDLSRLAELKRVRQILVQKYPALEGADHILGKAATIEELKKSARDILMVLKEKTKKEQKQVKVKKEVAEKKQPAIVNTVSESSVNSGTEVLTENFGDPLSRLASWHRESRK